MDGVIGPDSTEVHAVLERLLLERGGYAALDMLLILGWLRYVDVERWRNGDLAYLEDALLPDGPRVRRALELARRYVSALGLAPGRDPRMSCERTGRNVGLRASRDVDFDDLLGSHFQRPAEEGQLDLFVDSGAAVLRKDLVQALAQQQTGRASRLLEQMAREAADIAAFRRLLETQRDWLQDPANLSAAVVALTEDIEPLANRVLGTSASGYLVPLWRRATALLGERVFEPSAPELHASFAAARSLDWEGVCQAVQSEANWAQHPVLAFRRANALYLLGRRVQSLGAWHALFWNHPQAAARLIGATDQPDTALAAAWARFCKSVVSGEPALFPAWRLLTDPDNVGHRIEDTGEETSARSSHPVRAFRLVASLTDRGVTRPSVPNAEEIAVRRNLREESPALFEIFLRQREAGGCVPAHRGGSQ